MASNPVMFGVGGGVISRKEISRVAKIARRFGCKFIVVTGDSGHCTCGRGHQIDSCPRKRFWFVSDREQLGEPFDRELRRKVEGAVGDIKLG